MFKVLALTSFITISYSGANQVDLQVDMAAVETVYHSQGSDEFPLEETYTERTGKWRCIAKNELGKKFYSFKQDQEISILDALRKCNDRSNSCKKISCNTN